MINVQQIPFTLGAYQHEAYDVGGRYIFVKESTTDFLLELNGNSPFSIGNGEALDLEMAGQVKRFSIRNPTNSVITGVLSLSNFKIERWIASEVRTKQGAAFLINHPVKSVRDVPELLVPENQKRVSVSLQTTNSHIFVGGTREVSSQGVDPASHSIKVSGKIPLHSTVKFNVRGEIWGVVPQGQVGTVGIVEETD